MVPTGFLPHGNRATEPSARMSSAASSFQRPWMVCAPANVENANSASAMMVLVMAVSAVEPHSPVDSIALFR